MSVVMSMTSRAGGAGVVNAPNGLSATIAMVVMSGIHQQVMLPKSSYRLQLLP
jgi:hypothetical protein